MVRVRVRVRVRFRVRVRVRVKKGTIMPRLAQNNNGFHWPTTKDQEPKTKNTKDQTKSDHTRPNPKP
jgi:hypothetical protein